MAVTAGQVKELREKTGVGMMECKKALQENDGDLDQAIVWLRERGMSRAQKKADRIAAEGLVEVFTTPDQQAGVLLELNCETDFVSKNDDFRKFAKDMAELALNRKAKTVEELETAELDGQPVKDRLSDLIGKIGENMKLRRVDVVTTDNGVVTGYSHMGGRIGTLVAIEGGQGSEVKELGKDIAMHIAAAAPKYLTSDQVDPQELNVEKEIARKKLAEEGKPDDLIDKILTGQMKKFYKEICLVEQAFVKDPGVSIEKHVQSVDKSLKISRFTRFQLGEGIDKKQENFAEEVQAQLKK